MWRQSFSSAWASFILDCFPHQQTENDDDCEDEQELPSSPIIVVVPSCSIAYLTSRPRTTTITRMIPKGTSIVPPSQSSSKRVAVRGPNKQVIRFPRLG